MKPGAPVPVKRHQGRQPPPEVVAFVLMAPSTVPVAVLLLALSAAPVRADQPPIASGTAVTLHVGQRKSLEVGMAMGLECDDGTIVRAELVADSPTSNHLVLTGLKPGTTQCRAGTANVSRSKLVTITVTAKKNGT